MMLGDFLKDLVLLSIYKNVFPFLEFSLKEFLFKFVSNEAI